MSRLGSHLVLECAVGVWRLWVGSPEPQKKSTKKNIYPENEPSVDSEALSGAKGLSEGNS